MTAATPELAALLAQLVHLLAQPATPLPQPVPPAPSQRVLFTVDEAAEQLGIGKTKAYQLVRSGALESVRIGRLRRIHRDSITAYATQLLANQHRNAPHGSI
jgi:excisionase family DNA binding protein